MTYRNRKLSRIVSSILAVEVFLSCTSAYGQDATPEQGVSDPGAVEDIIVTAQRREENLQDAPVAITAITPKTLEARGITSLSNLANIAPNLSVTGAVQGPTSASLFIRSIGSEETLLTNDSPVAVYLDGIIIGRSTGAAFDVADLERIEVLRGPQGTLYGRNTIGGAVNLITRKPGDEFSLREKLSVGNYSYFQSRTSLDLGELGSSGLRAMVSYVHKQRDGTVDNLNQPRDDRDPQAYNVDSVRAALSYRGSGSFRADYAFDYSHSKAVPNANQMSAASPGIIAVFAGSPAAGGGTLTVSQDRLDKIRLDHSGIVTDEVLGHTLTLELDVSPDMKLRSLTGYRSWKEDVADSDLDGTGDLLGPMLGQGPTLRPVDLFSATAKRRQHQWSQELNLIGKIGNIADYVLGAYYFREKASEVNPQFFSVLVGGSILPLNTVLSYGHVSKTEAVFAQSAFHVTDHLTVTAGGRYTWDQRELDQASPINRALESSFRKFNWAISADYRFNEAVLAYARIATGYKAGGFNARSVNSGFGPEDMTSYELGLKTDLFDRRLRFNATAFYADRKNLQIVQFQAGSGGATSITTNAGAAKYTGIELEVNAVPVEGLNLYTNFGYVHRKFDEFIVLDPTTNTLVDIAKTGQARFTVSPSTTLNSGAEYSIPMANDMRVSARVDYTWQSKIYFSGASPFGAQLRDFNSAKSRGLLDARLSLSGLKLAGARAAISLWGRNLTDTEYRVSGIDFGGLGYATNVYGDPRTIGVDLTIEM